jgi:hypothetical protein
MNTLLEFLSRISTLLYALIAVGILFSVRGLIQARRAWRVAAFALEREAAHQRQRRSASAIVTLLLLAGMFYIIDTIVVPNLGSPDTVSTPTPPGFVTQQPVPTQMLLYPTITPIAGLPTEEIEGQQATSEAEVPGCELIGATITSPEAGQNVFGQVEVQGEANVLNFALYKFELKGAATGDEWVVVGTFMEPVPAGLLGTWDSTSLATGPYAFRLAVFRTDGTPITPCEIPIVIVRR